MRHVNDREPNFHAADGRLFLVRCFACGGEHGTENWAMAVSSGCCAFCGWADQPAPATAASTDAEESTKQKRDDIFRRMFS